MFNFSKKNILILILGFSSLALISAFYIEFFLNHKPCNLCLIERIPYYGSIIIIPSLFLFNKYSQIGLFVLSVLFIFGALISLYHVGIEKGFYEESLICRLKELTGSELTKENILKQIENSSVVSCKNVTFRILGLSLATINVIISFLISVILVKITFFYEKK